MNIGVWVRPGYSPSKGGGFSYYQALIDSFLSKNSDDSEVKYVFITPEFRPRKDKREPNCEYLGIIPRFCLNNSRLQKLAFFIGVRLLSVVWKKRLERTGVSLVYYINQDDLVLPNVPFIATLWDLGYYVTYPFPELVRGNNFNGRYNFIEKQLKRALFIFSESETGKRDLVKYAKIWEGKIKVVPMFPGDVVNMTLSENEQGTILKRFGLNQNDFFFYPAQFWAHKNHKTVVKAFSIYHQMHPTSKLIFTGSNKGNKEYIYSCCKELSIEEYVVFGGFVSIEELYTLYTNALATIMASFFGPTNMPPIEAMHLGCPVICSDIEGHREILEDAGLYFCASEYESLLNQMISVTQDRQYFKDKILQRKATTVFNKETALSCIDNYMMEAIKIRSQWK